MAIFLVTVEVLAICMLQLVSVLAQLPHPLHGAAAGENAITSNITTPLSVNGPSVLLTPTQNTFWVSPSNVFALGFLQTPISSANSSAPPSFTLSLFYSSLSQFQLTPVWTPHRGHLLSQNATLDLTAQGDLVLSDSGNQVWHTSTTGVASILVSDQGYVSLSGRNSSTVWRSWDHEPITDTLLPGQALVSGAADAVDNQGRYLLRVRSDSNFVLYFLGSLTQQITNHYWDADTYGLNVTRAYYNASQGLVLIDNKEHIVKVLLSTSLPKKLERIVLTESGTLTRYILAADGKSWFVGAQIPSSTCYVLGLCGPYGICMDDPSQNGTNSTNAMDSYYCTCPEEFYYVDPNNWFAGCRTNCSLDCDKGSKLTRLPGVQYGATHSSSTPYWPTDDLSTLDQCVQSCNSSCQCAAATYDGESCHLSSVGQVYSGNMQDSSYVTYLKTSVYPADNSTHTYTPAQVSTVEEGHTKGVISVGVAVGIGVAASLACLVGLANLAFWYYKSRQAANMSEVEDIVEGDEDEEEEEDEDEDEDELPLLGEIPIQFSYEQLKKASNGFKSLLGRGGFGPVYKGVLAGGTLVAIKRLEGGSGYGGEKQFRAEVMTIGSVHHTNLVRLHGYCAKGFHRMLVYEFLPRGSLNRYIFTDNKSTSSSDQSQYFFLDWETRFQILLSTARAIRYLHEECQPLIVHCDIKPENILLGEALDAKVSDFGMAQLVGGEAGFTSSVTRVRGTFGYMAPEWMSTKPITPKVDVFSFGIVVLEVISGRRAISIEVKSDSEVILSKWAYLQVMMESHKGLEILDPRLRKQVTSDASQHAVSPLSSTSTHDSGWVTTEEAAATVGDIAPGLDRAVLVALWCIHKNPSKRPSMGQVVQWLEGTMPVDPPPNPF